MTKSASTQKAAAQPRAEGARVALDAETANKVGFFGYEVDPTPDENYSVQTPPDAPTPETDPDAHAKAREAAGIGSGKFGDTATKKGGRS